MLLLLIRHAHAGDRDPEQWPDDRDRPLTDKGRKTHRKVSRALGKLELVPAQVLDQPVGPCRADRRHPGHRARPPPARRSPARRSRPSPTWPGWPTTSASRGRTPSSRWSGHSPWIEELAALLLTDSATGMRVDFPKSGVMGIELERPRPGAGELRFFLRPKMV